MPYTLERMFEQVHRALARGHDPAMDVWIDLAAVYASWVEQPSSSPVPMIKDKGLRFPSKPPGVLHGWVRTREGAWLGLVSYSVPTDSGVGPIRMRHLVPQNVATQRWPVGEEPF
jgi:hypothetical protein